MRKLWSLINGKIKKEVGEMDEAEKNYEEQKDRWKRAWEEHEDEEVRSDG